MSTGTYGAGMSAAGVDTAGMSAAGAGAGSGRVPGFLLAALSSGAGKTTVTMGITRFLQRQGLTVQVFKTGPDYIDPMFHTAVSGRPCVNLDPWFLEEGLARRLSEIWERYSAGADVCVAEAAMGLFSGISGQGSRGSAWSVAEALDLPVLLLVSPGEEAAAEELVSGLPKPLVRGILLNRVPVQGNGRALPEERGAGEEAPSLPEEIAGVPVLGGIPLLPKAALKSRHLGLTIPEKPEEALEAAERVCGALERGLDAERFLRAVGLRNFGRARPAVRGRAGAAEERQRERPAAQSGGRQSGCRTEPEKERLRLAVARDQAFCFLYEENLRLLREGGAELAFFSPLTDTALPPGTAGLYLPGGYPELFAEQLSGNRPMRDALANAIKGGLPTVAECGGFLYLLESLEDMQGAVYPMCGVLPGKGFRTPKLQRFGYIRLTAERDTLLLPAGEVLKGHEFHYWDAEHTGDAVLAEKASGTAAWPCVFGGSTLFAGFPHVWFTEAAAGRFLAAAGRYHHRFEGSES